MFKMKMAIVFLITGFMTPSFALENLSGSDVVKLSQEQLVCELKDLVTGRILDRRIAEYSHYPSEPILLLLGYRSLVAYVEDRPQVGSSERDLFLELKYQVGPTYGRATGHVVYGLDSSIEGQILGSVSLEEPDFQRPISLSCFLSTH